MLGGEYSGGKESGKERMDGIKKNFGLRGSRRTRWGYMEPCSSDHECERRPFQQARAKLLNAVMKRVHAERPKVVHYHLWTLERSQLIINEARGVKRIDFEGELINDQLGLGRGLSLRLRVCRSQCRESLRSPSRAPCPCFCSSCFPWPSSSPSSSGPPYGHP
jgi:hypothetical protein